VVLLLHTFLGYQLRRALNRKKGGCEVEPETLSPDLRAQVLVWQKTEITGHHTYKRLASVIKDPHNRDVVHQIAQEEENHYLIFKTFTGVDVAPNRFQVFIYYWIARLLGLTFGIKLMERPVPERAFRTR